MSDKPKSEKKDPLEQKSEANTSDDNSVEHIAEENVTSELGDEAKKAIDTEQSTGSEAATENSAEDSFEEKDVLEDSAQSDNSETDLSKEDKEGDANGSEILSQTDSKSELELISDKLDEQQKDFSNRIKKLERSRPRWFFPWRTGLIFVFMLACVGVAYWAKQIGEQKLAEQNEKIAAFSSLLAQSEAKNQSAINKAAKAQAESVKALSANLKTVKTQYSDLQLRIAAQAKRLRSMSDTSREDWLLAEAQYLLKLANQRIRIERNGDGVAALLEEADNILRDMEDPDLHPLRRAIAQDLAAVRLMEKIDIEGMYLSLVALSEQVENLPMQFEQFAVKKPNLIEVELSETVKASVWDKIKGAWGRFVSSLSNSYRVVSMDEMPKPILPPESHAYLQQNLRLKMERAQLALLREQQDIYRQSLQQADDWIKRYYSPSNKTLVFRNELAKLKEAKIVQEFPSVSNSLGLLHEYIEDLHDLKGVAKPTPDSQSN